MSSASSRRLLGATAAVATVATLAALAYYLRRKSKRCLAIALGGSSDIIGCLAYAAAAGYSSIILVQPGSPPSSENKSGDKKPPALKREASQRVSLKEIHTEHSAPGGSYFDNDTMVAYLLRANPLPACRVTAGFYYLQPKDVPGGFSRTMVERAASDFAKLAKEHECDAIIGLDFGGDVALPEPPTPAGAASGTITQRDLLNLKAALLAAKQSDMPCELVAACPGVDAAGVAPDYWRAADAAACPALGSSRAHLPVLEMSADGVLVPVAGPPPPCELPILPAALFARRLDARFEAAFRRALRRLTATLMRDVPPKKRHEHTSKTYYMMSAVDEEAARRQKAAWLRAPAEFVALGRYRAAERQRAHLHSASALGVYDVGGCAGPL